jgi:LemA protein
MWIVWGILVVLAFSGIWIFNRLVQLGHRAAAAWADIDVQLKRRWELVPALVTTVKGYAEHENDVLVAVVEARTRARDKERAGAIAGLGVEEAALEQAVHRVFALGEAYPELKADKSFSSLHESLVDVENHIQYARRCYNAVVRDHNTLIESFPHHLLAALFRFAPREYFQVDALEEREAPSIDLDRDSPAGKESP